MRYPPLLFANLAAPGTAEEVASVLAFLLPGAAGYINGATIAIDGAAS